MLLQHPARRKFLKSPNTEYAHCEAAFERIALAHPEVEMTLRHNGKVSWRLARHTLAERVGQLLSNDFAAGALERGRPGRRPDAERLCRQPDAGQKQPRCAVFLSMAALCATSW